MSDIRQKVQVKGHLKGRITKLQKIAKGNLVDVDTVSIKQYIHKVNDLKLNFTNLSQEIYELSFGKTK